MKQTPHAPLIAPSILSADFARIADEVRRIEDAGADLIHLDVMDGVFVPNISFGPKFVADMRKITKLPFDVHLMITSPERYVPQFIDAGADFLTVHYEALISGQWPVAGGQFAKDGKTQPRNPKPGGSKPPPYEPRTPNPESLYKTLAAIKKAGVKCGIAISPDTPVSVLKGILKNCDLALLMSVYPGFGGQKFIEKSLERLAELTALVKSENPEILIEIDGGITLENAPAVKAAGASILVAGNTIFSAPDAKAVVCALRGEKRR